MNIYTKYFIGLVITFYSATANAQSIAGIYRPNNDSLFIGEFFFQLELKRDHTFEYEESFKHGTAKANGKWIMNKDTLTLSEYENNKEIDTVILSFEPNIPEDSICIRFNKFFGPNDPSFDFTFILNENCTETFTSKAGRITIKKRTINSIRLDHQKYEINNNAKFNSILIKANPLTFLVSPRIPYIAKWLRADHSFYLLDCMDPNSGEPWGKRKEKSPTK